MNVLLSEEPQFLAAPTLLVHASKPFRQLPEMPGCWQLTSGGHYDFTTYFNALSIRKWRKYTAADSFGLHMEVRGGAGVVSLTAADSFDYLPRKLRDSHSFVSSKDWQEIDIPLPSLEEHVLEAFVVQCDGEVSIRNVYYFANVKPGSIRSVELALCTTTYKKEAYITRNIDLVRREILESSDPIAKHFTMHVVDNGRTLDARKLSSPRIIVHPNPNAGGAGGFARGMIEAIEQRPRATHVLLMDDDVLVSAESIIRTYNLLSIIKDEYSEAFVSGAMMNMEDPGMRWEELGYIGFDGAFHPVKPSAYMTTVHNVVDGEVYDIPSYMPGCADQDQVYAAWWYCAIPMTQIDRNGLPLPVFVRGDDVEYSRRCKPRFITMNGICIWHMAFHTRYSAAQERYQMTRNCLLDQFVSDVAPLSDFIGCMTRAFHTELRKFNYANAELILQGFEDFLKGPEWIMRPVAQKAFVEANGNAEQLIPFAEIEDELRSIGVELKDLTDWKVWRDLPYSRKDRIIDRFTENGQQFSRGFTQSGKVAVIDNVGWAEVDGKIRGAEIIVALDMPSKRGAIRRIDRARFKQLSERFKSDLAEFEKNKDRLKSCYTEARAEMTSIAFWKEYLGLTED